MSQVGYISNYADLKTAIADVLDRSDLATVIGMFIQLAEGDINTKLRHHKMVVKATANCDADDPVVKLPTDWLEARNLEIDDQQITYQSPDMLDLYRKMNPTPSDTTPQIYSFYDSNIEVWPTPTEDYTIEMDYYRKVGPLKDEVTGSNWLLADAPGVYLYGALVHSAPYLRDDTRVALWTTLYEQQLALLVQQSKKAMTSGSRITRAAPVSFG